MTNNMKKAYKYLIPILAVALASCNRFEPVDHVFDNSVYLDVSEAEQTQISTFNNRVSEARKSIAAKIAYPADKEVKADISVDESLIAEYNRRNGTSYTMLPAQYFDFPSQTVTIAEGRTISEKVSINFKGLTGEGEEHEGAMELDKTWILPVRVTSDDIDVMSSAAVAYYLVKRTSAITVAAQLDNAWVGFPEMDKEGSPVAAAYNGLTAVTYEAIIFIDEFLTQKDDGIDINISSIMGVEQYLLLRIGDTNFQRKQLQFDGSGSGSQFGKLPSKGDAAKNLYAGTWYHVACTYDQATRTARIYLNGEVLDEIKDAGVTGSTEENRINLAQRALPGASGEERQFFIGISYDKWRPMQGKIAEARVWKCARSQEEIREHMQGIDKPKEEEDLIGYWKFDDGEGNVITDYSKVGNHGTNIPMLGNPSGDIKWPDGIEIPTDLTK